MLVLVNQKLAPGKKPGLYPIKTMVLLMVDPYLLYQTHLVTLSQIKGLMYLLLALTKNLSPHHHHLPYKTRENVGVMS